MTDDLVEPYRASDAKLKKIIVVAAFQVAAEVDFSQDYAVSASAETISPDPTEDPTKEDSFVNLVCLKAACVIDRGGAVVAATRAIAVRDGGSSVDLRGVFQGKFELLKRGWCAVYDDAKFEHECGRAGAGAVVLTPFRLYAREWGY